MDSEQSHIIIFMLERSLLTLRDETVRDRGEFKPWTYLQKWVDPASQEAFCEQELGRSSLCPQAHSRSSVNPEQMHK